MHAGVFSRWDKFFGCNTICYNMNMSDSFYQDYDVPEDLRFRTQDILRNDGLNCTTKFKFIIRSIVICQKFFHHANNCSLNVLLL